MDSVRVSGVATDAFVIDRNSAPLTVSDKDDVRDGPALARRPYGRLFWLALPTLARQGHGFRGPAGSGLALGPWVILSAI